MSLHDRDWYRAEMAARRRPVRSVRPGLAIFVLLALAACIGVALIPGSFAHAFLTGRCPQASVCRVFVGIFPVSPFHLPRF